MNDNIFVRKTIEGNLKKRLPSIHSINFAESSNIFVQFDIYIIDDILGYKTYTRHILTLEEKININDIIFNINENKNKLITILNENKENENNMHFLITQFKNQYFTNNNIAITINEQSIISVVNMLLKQCKTKRLLLKQLPYINVKNLYILEERKRVNETYNRMIANKRNKF